MIRQMYAILDMKAKVYGTPFMEVNHGAAMRACAGAVNRADENNLLHKHTQDFALYHVGSFNDDTGDVGSCEKPVLVVQCSELKESGSR